MAIGVSVGVANNRNAKAVYATETDNGDGTFSDTISGGTVVGTGTSATITWTIGGGNITIVSRSGGGNTVANTNRLYRYNYVEVTASNNYSISNLEITYDGTYRGANNAGGTAITNNRISAGQANVPVTDTNVSNGTITVSPDNSANTHFFFQNAATGTANTQLRWTEFKINYNKPNGGENPSTPSLAISGPNYLVDGTSATISGNITNDDSYTITWSANDANVSFNPATSSSGSNVSVSFNGVTTGTAPIIITGTLNNEGEPVTNNKNIYALEHAGSQADPFSATDAQVFSHTNYAAQSGGDWYVQGYVVSIYSTNKGYYIDENPENTSSKKFEVYNNGGVTNDTGKSIIAGTSYIVAHGSMTCYNNSQSEITGSVIYSVDNGAEPDGITLSLNHSSLNLDLNGSLTGSLTATAVTTGTATSELTAESDDESVATISTDEPSSGVAFTVTAVSVGTAHITITSVWDANESVSCTVSVVDTTPRIVNFKKIDSLQSGQHVLITSVVDDSYYYMPSTTTGGSTPPSAVECSYNSTTHRITSIDANMTFIVSGDSSGWTFTNSAGSTLYISGDSNNNSIRIGSTSHSFTTNQTTNGFYLQSTSYTRFVGIYNKADWRCYNSRTASNYKWSEVTEYNCDWINFWVEAKPDQTISGSTAAYTIDTVTLTSTADSPTWSLVDGETTAAGAAVSAAGVVSVTGPGVVKVKASHDDYEDAYYVITFTVKPEDPFIEPATDSASGYSGQNEFISFTYGNLKSSLLVVSNNVSVLTIGTLSANAGSGTVQFNYVGAGSTTAKFKDGDNELASVSVTVTASTVTITGLPASSSVALGNTLDLGSMITVSPTGSCSNEVTWESDNESAATVSSSGVVTGKALGVANITVTSNDYPSATMTCSITVLRIAFTKVNSFQNGKRYIIGAVGNSNPNELYYLPAGTEAVASNPAAVQVTSLANLTKADAWMASVDASNHIVFSNEYEGTTYYLTATNAAQGISIKTTNDGYWILDGTGLKYSDAGSRHLGTNGNSSFRYYSSLGSGQVYATEFYEYIPTSFDKVNDLLTQTKLSYRYEDNGNGGFDYTDISIRFGGLISKALWDELDTNEHNVSGFGVMIASGEALNEDEYIKDNLGARKLADAQPAPSIDEADIVDYYMSKAEMATPVESGDNYFWNLFQTVDEADISKVFVAVAYIKIGDEYVFMEQVRYSVKTLAADYIANRDCSAETAGGSLSSLAN